MKTVRKCFVLLLASLLLCSAAAMPAAAVEDPEVSFGKSYIVYCVEADEVLWERNPDILCYPAALVKLMTALIAADLVDQGVFALDQEITCSVTAIRSATGITAELKVGEVLRLSDLLGIMILTGANDATLVIAETLSGSVKDFVTLMNDKAKSLGMEHTVYTNPTGLHDTRMVTTANDLLILARYVLSNQFLTDLCKTEKITVPATNLAEVREYGTRNFLVSNRVSQDYYLPIATGLICGSTNEADFCIIGTAQHNGLDYIAVVLNAADTKIVLAPETRFYDEDGNVMLDTEGNEVVIPEEYEIIVNGFLEAATLLRWADESFHYIKAIDDSVPICQIPIKLARNIDHIALIPESAVEIYVPTDLDRDKDLEMVWELYAEEVTAPVKAGTAFGTLTVRYLGKTVGTVPLVVKSNIEASGSLTLLNYVKTLIKTPFFLAIMIGIGVCAVVYVFYTAWVRQRRRNEAKKAKEKNHYLQIR